MKRGSPLPNRSSDHGIGNGAGAVGEYQLQARSAAVEPDELLAEMDDLARTERKERLVQRRAMQRNVGRAEALLDFGAHGMQIGDVPGIPFAIESDLRGKSGAANARFEPEPAQGLHRVRVHLDSGADAGERRGLLVDLGVEADLAQRRGRGQACDPSTDDRYRRFRARQGARPLNSP